MIILVPDSVCDDLQLSVAAISPDVQLRPYSEEGPMPSETESAVAVLRWIAGKRYSEIVDAGPNIQWLHTASAGVDHVLTPAVRMKPGLTVSDSGPAFEIAMSEFVLAWLLMVARRLPLLLDRQKAHQWEWFSQQELYGQTVGIIGLGSIGRGIAARTKAFGMRTLGLRRRNEPVPNVDKVLTGPDGLTTLLSESDYVILAAALTDSTRSLLSADRIAQMKQSAWLINIARGAMVDEAALTTALQNGKLAGACLDVFVREPLPGDSPLWDMPNVYISPHNSPGWTDGLQRRQKQLFLDNVRRFVQHEPLTGVVDIEQGY